jgi:2-polyprenyl-3-methyl-5-hydroxy-6-metoxy-1,4-benzoquinol methylase
MNSDNGKRHWNNVYAGKKPEELSWFQQDSTFSIKIIASIAQDRNAAIIDVGGGASSLVDSLLLLDYLNLSVLDISEKAIEHSKQRLADKAEKVSWYVEDILHFKPSHKYDVWHDRAVFHFLTDKVSREAYVRILRDGLKVGGYAVIATFAIDGPKKCSGLEVVQYDRSSIEAELGDGFILLEAHDEHHLTPKGSTQNFIYFIFRRK